jgi:hypothetical protein
MPRAALIRCWRNRGARPRKLTGWNASVPAWACFADPLDVANLVGRSVAVLAMQVREGRGGKGLGCVSLGGQGGRGRFPRGQGLGPNGEADGDDSRCCAVGGGWLSVLA